MGKKKNNEKVRTLAKRIIIATIVIIFISLSASRAVSLTRNYGATLQVYSYLSGSELQSSQIDHAGKEKVNICVGKEWYRFPSNFFLPSERYQLQFLKSGFGGQLPKPYSPLNGTYIIPTGFNNLNKEEVDRYVWIFYFPPFSPFF